MQAAQRAFPAWQRDDNLRRQALLEAASVLRANADTLGEILTLEQGKPLAFARGEAYWCADIIETYAGMKIPVDLLQDDGETRIEVHRMPYGVVAAIVPWNFPILMACIKSAQALLVGNTVVLKPSPYTPLATLKLGELWREVFPPGVVNMVSGGNDVGAAMTSHPAPRKISFTGSVATGKKVALSAAADLKVVTLELGGNDAAVVLPDVEPEAVAEGVIGSAFFNSGQVCIAVKRLYVHESVYPQVLQAMVRRVRAMRVGNGMDPDTEMGPLNNRMQFERVLELLEDVNRSGGRVQGGSAPSGGGYYVAPSIVTEVAEGTRLVDEEQFGPTLPVMPYREVEEAIERANATHFGLGGSVWTSDVERGRELAAQLDCGTAWVNQHGAISPGLAPQPTAKWSGIGHELGTYGIDAYTRLQVIRSRSS
jgi:acyl-CoA reductase-like NAD-dependent aldehyde dehydrogenase